MSETIDLEMERNKREQPAPDHIRRDDFGRPLYEFLLGYEAQGSHWSTSIWAYDEADAMEKVEGMRRTLEYRGQIFSVFPA